MRHLGLVCALLLCSALALAEQAPAPLNAAVYFISPAHGEVVRNPVKIRFGLMGMGVAPAGVALAKTGHHHLLVDIGGYAKLSDPVPQDERHIHFSNGETETTLDLMPGKHELQLLVADDNHVPHKPAVVSRKIVIYVEE